MTIKSETLQPGIRERFVAEVESRCKAIDMRPPVLCVMADVGYGCWRTWVNGEYSPTASTMDKVLAELAHQEKLRIST